MKKQNTHIKLLIRTHLEDNEPFVSDNAIHVRGEDRGGLLRLPLKDEGTVIVKLWRIRSDKEKIKWFFRLHGGWKEWRMHSFLYKAGIAIPKPIGFYRFTLRNGEQWETMAIEDLGTTERGLNYIKRLIAEKNEEDIRIFENSLINVTEEFIRIGIFDIDHQLNNFLVNSNSNLFRIDFECAKLKRWKNKLPLQYAEMLARLIASHVYAVQPDVVRTEQFAKALYSRLNLDSRIKAAIENSVTQKLKFQYRNAGINSKVSLPN